MYEAVSGRFMNPTLVVSHFHLREGDKVADFGAGSGAYMEALSKAVGREGTVYMCEVQKPLVEALGAKAREAHFSNVRAVWGDMEVIGGSTLKDGSLDAVLLSNTLFQITDKQSLFKEIARVLRSGGKLFIIDWMGSFGGIGPKPEDVVTEFEARALGEAAGFMYDRFFPVGEHHYGIALRK